MTTKQLPKKKIQLIKSNETQTGIKALAFCPHCNSEVLSRFATVCPHCKKEFGA